MELVFSIPLYASKEVVEVLFYSGRWLFASRISICNPESAACDPPISYYRRWECRIKGNTISLTHKSVKFEDQGIYAVVATNAGILYDSAILNITTVNFTLN
ncbi:hypothetical protein CHS0354_034083 [Potamilus streckersoni]|uniref:Uncharacterized protein n=1 Tax=Potamilus streckersoni TaxID=2493646 RepID=A0AAE0VJG5_9BIVA|nr:hypothetical protein CHS0354_034083 [Potamilus streckersoni]